MAGPKEAKESVNYPASKRKPPPFKPHRPAKLLRTETDRTSLSSTTERRQASIDAPRASTSNGKTDEDHDTWAHIQSSAEDRALDLSGTEEVVNSSSDDLPEDPLENIVVSKPRNRTSQHAPSRPTEAQTPEDSELQPLPEIEGSDISQALLLRLMHEHFESKDTRIDKHAIKLVQRYVDIFLRETVARAALSQEAEVESGAASQSDRGWLDKKDLEKVAGGIILDF